MATDQNEHEKITTKKIRTNICITKKVCVKPKISNPNYIDKVLTLSNLDRQCPMLMYLVSFYKSPCTTSDTTCSKTHNNNANYIFALDSIFDGLKSGLEETLSIWYPAAGRLCMNRSSSDHHEVGKLNICCNNEGAILVEGVTRLKLCELGDLSQYNEFFENLVYKPVFADNFLDMPLVVAQVTRFGCGGYSVGLGTSHALFDGPSTYNFLCAWAYNSRMITEQNTTITERELQQQKPVHERDTLLMINNSNGQIPNTTALAIDHLYQLIQQAFVDNQNLATIDHKMLGHELGCSNFVLSTFHLSGAMVGYLKRKLIALNPQQTCSSFEVVTSYLWKARTKAYRVNEERMVCLQFAADTRNKMMPPLGKGFSGNAYVLSSITMSASELERSTLDYIVEKIKQAKNSVNKDYVNAYMNALDQGPPQRPPTTTLPPLKELTLVSDWTKMPFHKVGFLCGEEEAIYASPVLPPIPQVAYFLQSPVDSRGIDVRIGLAPQVVNDFTHYFMNVD